MTTKATMSVFHELVPADAELRLIADGFTWAEGPTWDPTNNQLVFSDVQQNRLLGWSEEGGLADLLKPSDHQNGHCLDADGNLIACSHGQRALVRRNPDGAWEVLADRFEGKRFNSPNDAALHPDGSIWFTDPTYGLAKPEEGYGGEKEIEGQWVFRLTPDGELTAPIRDRDQPNGLAFIDETHLLVADTGDDAGTFQYTISPAGEASRGELFCTVDPGITDGLRIGESGFLWMTAEDGVHILTPHAEEVGRIFTPKTASNVCFGGPNGSTLYITATDAVWAIETRDRAHNPRLHANEGTLS